MPTLNWIGKEAVVNHDKEVPFRLLKKVKAHSVGENSQNLIIHGDNLEALKALMPYYQGKIKCIYIDPPYNTGNESWVYNDKVNSPKIKKWLGKVVGGESEDLCRHDKWLCMMYPRLKLLRDLLSDDGVIFVSIEDNEQANLKILIDEIFGEENFLGQLIWKNKTGGGNDSGNFVIEHEYILVYGKIKELINRFSDEYNDIAKYVFEDEYVNERGKYMIDAMYRPFKNSSDSLIYPITCPDGSVIYPNESNKQDNRYNWRWSQKTFYQRLKEGRVEFKKTKNGWRVYKKQYLLQDDDGSPRTKTFRSIIDFVGQRQGSEELKNLFDSKVFQYPKSSQLIKKLVFLSTAKDAIVLDSFAGSGTTAHAVMELNKEDAGNRKFILIEMEDYAKDITAERVKRAIEKNGYKDGFEYCELDKPLFNEDGQIEEECDFEQLATYIYFTETNTNLDKKSINKPFIGDHNEKEIYLLFKEKDKNILNKEFLRKINKNNKKKVIYADKCLIDNYLLEKYNIQFKQIPYEVKIY